MLALSIGTRSFSDLLQPLDYGQVATVPFLWAERLLTLIGGVSSYTLRVVPLVAGIVLLGLVYRLAGIVAGQLPALLALALSATAYPLMRYSVEVKPYIVDSLICALLIWIAVGLAENLDERRRWLGFAVAGSLGVLISTPALLVCAAAAMGLAVAAARKRRLHLVPWIALLGVLWGAIFVAAYLSWYATNAGAPYMQQFWSATFLRPGTPHFLSRFWLNLGDLSCTLTCWRGGFDLTPLLLVLAALGMARVARRRGLEYGIFLAGPILAAFGASMLGRYPIATRLVLFSAPLFAILVATGAVVVATWIERAWPRVRTRWTLILLLYPSLVVATALAFAAPAEWGFRGMEVRPLAEVYQNRAGGEPVYVFPRAVAAWVFHTTDWNAPDTARLAWVAKIAGPGGTGFVNGASRGRRPLGEGANLVYTYFGVRELYGTSTGAQGRMGVGYTPPQPDAGWAESEAWRMKRAAQPYIWIVIADYAHGPLDERAILMAAVAAAGGEVVFTRAASEAVLYRVRFPPAPAG